MQHILILTIQYLVYSNFLTREETQDNWNLIRSLRVSITLGSTAGCHGHTQPLGITNRINRNQRTFPVALSWHQYIRDMLNPDKVTGSPRASERKNDKYALFSSGFYKLLSHTRYYIKMCTYLLLFIEQSGIITWILLTVWTGENWQGLIFIISRMENRQAAGAFYVTIF